MSRQHFGGIGGAQKHRTNEQDKASTKKGGPRSNSPGMFAAVGLAQASLSVFLAEDILFLHPETEGAPSEDPCVAGSVHLYLPKARTLKTLTVRLQGKQDIGWPNNQPYESCIILDKVVTLNEGKEVHLAKGEHTFSFMIIVPSSVAPYERCQYGRVRHSITAKAKGVGSMGGDIISGEKSLYLIVNPGGAGESEPPPPLHHRIEGMTDELGPYTMALQSQHCMVAGLLLFRFTLVSPPTDINIHNIKVKVNQQFNLRSAINPEQFCNPTPDPRTVMLLNAAHPPNFGTIKELPKDVRSGTATPHGGHLKLVPKGTEYKFHHLGRFPNDNVIRPTTRNGTEAGIRVSHEIAVEVTYSLPSEDAYNETLDKDKRKGKEPTRESKRKLVVTKPLELCSCNCFVDSLTLPPYSLLDPNPEPESDSPPCLCGASMPILIESHGKNLLREEGEDGVTYAPLVKENSDSPVTSPSWNPSNNPFSPGSPAPARSRSEDDSRGRAMRPSFFRASSSQSNGNGNGNGNGLSNLR